jgi:glycosyltransferase involved in cell wall biosynthesis
MKDGKNSVVMSQFCRVKTRILFIYPNQFGYHTDTFKYCQYLNNEYDISYICFDQGFEKITLPGINVIYLQYNTGKFKRLSNYLYYIIHLSRIEQIDIIFTVQFKFCFLIGIFAKSKVKILDYRTGDLNSNSFIRFLSNRLLLFDSLFFKNISVISEGLAGILGLRLSKTLILPLGGDAFTNKKHSFNTMNLLYVGHLHIRNIFQTVEGLAFFLQKYPAAKNKVSYLIIGFGDPEDEQKLKEYISKYDLEKTVHFLGRLKYTELVTYFESCNIGVSYIPITPYYQHQPSTKTFEYINSGLFTIATNTFENHKVISKSNGVLCNDDSTSFSEALENVFSGLDSINDNDIRNSLNEYQWDKIVYCILKPYFEDRLNRTNLT